MKKALPLFLGLAALYAVLFGLRFWWSQWARSVELSTGKPSYLHYEFVDIRLRARDPKLVERWRRSPPKASVLFRGKEVSTVAHLRDLELKYDSDSGAWIGLWPCPWNAEPGRYDLRLAGFESELAGRLRTKSFEIRRRRPKALPPGFVALTLESVMPLQSMKVTAPSGEKKDWRGLLDWVEYVGADAFWVLGGQTPGQKPGEVWMNQNLAMIPMLARECRRRGIKFGVYAMCYLTMSSSNKIPGYEYALEIEDGKPVETRAVSLREKKRVRDVIEILKKFRGIPEVDYLGIDYVRNALGGYELAEEFYAEMPGLRPPPDWGKLSRQERMVYFARKKVMRRDHDFIDAWQWWRAHLVGQIVSQIKGELGEEKPLWAFTLTWDKGWHHGQDPVMMNDAGVDADALMLYEATGPQFHDLIQDWNGYVKRRDAQLVVGDVIDWPLHQRHPEGPKEFYRRSILAIDKIYSDGPAAGVFFHDLSRALWGRVGPWGTKAWMDEARNAARYFRSLPQNRAPGDR
ncbi:MAG: hypothetical protein HY921_09925 [Elusimicrobia bacterium]|nr:hypothetical protein [Elusimicrobiota bacterium]